MQEFLWTSHAIMEMLHRGIAAAAVWQVLESPGQRLVVRVGREAWHSILADGYLLWVVIDVDRNPRRVEASRNAERNAV